MPDPAGYTTTTSTQSLPPWAQGHASNVMQGAEDLYRNYQPQYYPGQMVQGFDPAQQAAMAGMSNMAMGQSPYLGGAGQQFGQTMGGGYLNPYGPQALQGYSQAGMGGLGQLGATAGGHYGFGGGGFQNAMDAAQRQIQARVGSQFGGAGRYNSGLEKAAMGEGLANAFAGLYGQERNRQVQAGSQLGNMGLGGASQLGGLYGQERGNQLQALGMSPMLEQSRWGPMQNLMNVGSMYQQQGQRQIDADRQRYDYYRDDPYTRLQRYGNTTAGMIPGAGGTATQSNPYFQGSTGAGILGGGMAGAGMGQMMGQSGTGLLPWMIGGGLLGGMYR